jgi:hypothetical protein
MNIQTKTVFTDIQAIRDHKFVGNHYSDNAAFDAIELFAADDKNSILERSEALRIMAKKGMGLDDNEAMTHMSDEDMVADFMFEYEPKG